MRTVLLAALILVLGANIGAYAANGKPLLLGKANKATKTTKLATAKGPALNLRTKPGTPPLAVSSTGKVTNLNADTVDGLDATAFQKVGSDPKSRVYTFTLPTDGSPQNEIGFKLQGAPAGKYLASYSISVVDAANAVPRCYFGKNDPVTEVIRSTSPAAPAALSATGLLDTALHDHITCKTSGDPMQIDPTRASVVTLVPIDEVIAGTLAGAS